MKKGIMKLIEKIRNGRRDKNGNKRQNAIGRFIARKRATLAKK